MRLLDKCLIQKKFKDVLPDAVICADAIAAHVYMSDKQRWGSGDFPFCKPPWLDCFVEWNSPKNMNIGGTIVSSGKEPEQVGFYCSVANPTCSRFNELRELALNPLDAVGLSRDTTIETIVCSRLYGVYKGGVQSPDFIHLAFLDPSGSYLCSAGIGPDAEHFCPDGLTNYEPCLYLTFTFCNCSNVKIEDVTDDIQPIAKLRRRFALPEVKRYTLNIAGHVSRPSRDYNEGPQGVMPFHLCRGHFATYTADKPMFGNPKLVGRYWHPPHMKGKKENGEIIKDYAIA